MSETDISRHIREAVNTSRLAYVVRVQSGSLKGGRIHFAPSGTADLLGYMRDGSGRFLGIEVKTATGTMQDKQTEFQTNVRDAKAVCIVARSVPEALAALMHETTEWKKRNA